MSITYYDNIELSDPDLMGLAKKAYLEMRADLEKLKNENQRLRTHLKPLPGSMAALAIRDRNGYQVIFSSTLKGMPPGNSFIWNLGTNTNRARGALQHCMIKSQTDLLHRLDAHCAEPMALYAYYEKNPNAEPTSETRRAWVAAWGREGDDHRDGQGMNPCLWEDGKGPGCDDFLYWAYITAVHKDVVPTSEDRLPEPNRIEHVCILPELSRSG